MQALETEYRGIKYRSRTEARWAVYLDELRVTYNYEPEGFDLGGEWYLPDFWLPSPGMWFEVKGIEPNERERRLACALSKASRCPVVIAVGPPPIVEDASLRIFTNGSFSGNGAFTGYGNANIFVSNEWGNVIMTVRGSAADTGGIPDQITGPARIAAACRFGVHD